MNDLEQTNMLQPLVDEIETAVSNAKKEIAEKVNSVITETYWKIGKYIVEFEQDGNVKAAYGSKLLTTLSHQLTLRLGRGYSRPKCHVQAKIEEYDIDATIVDVAVTGSRCRGLEHEGSDLDVVVELSTAEREDDLFNAFNEDTVLYHDSTRNMTENVSELAESIKQGDTGHLTTWLADIISEGAVPEEIKRATELLEKLTEYKPLAKIEEAEEQNYNMIDNVLNNGVGEKAQREENKRMEEKPPARVSLKVRLAEKKAQVEGKSKEHDVQENEKKSHREM